MRFEPQESWCRTRWSVHINFHQLPITSWIVGWWSLFIFNDCIFHCTHVQRSIHVVTSPILIVWFVLICPDLDLFVMFSLSGVFTHQCVNVTLTGFLTHVLSETNSVWLGWLQCFWLFSFSSFYVLHHWDGKGYHFRKGDHGRQVTKFES